MLRRTLRPKSADECFRYGGEEFVLVFENTSLHTAKQVAERVRLRVADGPIHLHDVALGVATASTNCRTITKPHRLVLVMLEDGE